MVCWFCKLTVLPVVYYIIEVWIYKKNQCAHCWLDNNGIFWTQLLCTWGDNCLYLRFQWYQVLNLLKGIIFTQILFQNTLKKISSMLCLRLRVLMLKYMKLSDAFWMFYLKNSKTFFQWTWHYELQLLFWHSWYTNTYTV